MKTEKLIRFLQNSGSYNAGETAGFSDVVARGYIDRGVAEYFTTEMKQSPVDKKVSVPEPTPVDIDELPNKKSKAILRRRRRREEED